jgi:hypothetical protein
VIDISSSFRKFLEFTGIIYRNYYGEILNVHWCSASPYGCGQEENPEIWTTNSWFPLHDNAPAHWSVLVKDFLAKNNVKKTGLVLVDFYLFARMNSALKGRNIFWCYWHHWECDGRTEKVSIQRFPGIFLIHSQMLAEVRSCTRTLSCRKFNWSGCAVLYFSEINRFREHFEAAT